MKKKWLGWKISLLVIGLVLGGGFLPVQASAATGTCTYGVPTCGDGETAFTINDGSLENAYCGEWCEGPGWRCSLCVKSEEKENVAKTGCDYLLGDKAGEDTTAYQNCINCIKNSNGDRATLDQCASQYKNMTEKEVLQIEGGFTLAGGNLDNLRADQLQAFNPLRESTNPELSGNNVSISAIISAALKIIYPLVGVLLFALLIWGGIEVLIAGTTANSSRAQQGRKRIFAAIVGAVIVFASMLIIKIIEALLGIDLGL